MPKLAYEKAQRAALDLKNEFENDRRFLHLKSASLVRHFDLIINHIYAALGELMRHEEERMNQKPSKKSSTKIPLKEFISTEEPEYRRQSDLERNVNFLCDMMQGEIAQHVRLERKIIYEQFTRLLLNRLADAGVVLSEQAMSYLMSSKQGRER